VKKRDLIPWLILITVLNSVLPFGMSYVADLMRIHWHEILPGEGLPDLTLMAFRMPPFFYVFTAFSVGGCVGIFLPRIGVGALVHAWCAASICELGALVLFVAGVAWPAGRIFYGIGPGA